jgi:hypothetical protein
MRCFGSSASILTSSRTAGPRGTPIWVSIARRCLPPHRSREPAPEPELAHITDPGALRIGDASIRRAAVIFLSRASITTRSSEDDRSFSVLALPSTAARSGATPVGRDAVARTQDADPRWPPVRHPDDHRSSLTEA